VGVEINHRYIIIDEKQVCYKFAVMVKYIKRANSAAVDP